MLIVCVATTLHHTTFVAYVRMRHHTCVAAIVVVRLDAVGPFPAASIGQIVLCLWRVTPPLVMMLMLMRLVL